MPWLSRLIPSKQVWSFPKRHRGLFFPSGLAEAKDEMDNFSIKRIVKGEETWDEVKSKVK